MLTAGRSPFPTGQGRGLGEGGPWGTDRQLGGRREDSGVLGPAVGQEGPRVLEARAP